MSLSEVLAGIIFGAVGWWIFSVGRRNAEIPKVVIGLILMLYSMFVPNAAWSWGVGLALCAYAYYNW